MKRNILRIMMMIVGLSVMSFGSDMDASMQMMDHSSMQMTAVTNIDVMTPVEEIMSKRFTSYEKYEEYAHQIMMTDNSKYLTNDTGNLFAVYMTLHHEAAIITSLGIKDISTDTEVVKLATNIANAQIGEVKEMQTLIASNRLKGNNSVKFGEKMSDIMDSMMVNMQVPSYAITSDEATKLYLQNMIVHHEGAIEMAKEYVKVGKNKALLKISNDILKTQNKEIKQMEKILKK